MVLNLGADPRSREALGRVIEAWIRHLLGVRTIATPITELKNADSPTSNTATYLTKDALVISVSVPHALGDHIEITLPYKDLQKYKTRSTLWDVLEAPAAS
jgi:hypothetical protein